MVTRQPIVSVLGHVDHGKTSLLDRVRGTAVADREAGRITQHIGATEVPLDAIRQACGPLMEGRDFKLPGLLFIDTPGHRAFATLRARGGALADIAIVVVDIREGLMPQTREALRILRQNKTPFIVAANKLDRVPGWQSGDDRPFIQGVGAQEERTLTALEDATYELIGALHDEGFPSDRYDRIKDFRKTVAIVPCSAMTGEGLPDLLLTLTGLAQRFLEEELVADLEGPGKATVLEVKEERGLGSTLDVILYDGRLEAGQLIVVGTSGEPLATTIRALLKPKPLDEIRDPRDRFDSVESIHAASGLKISAANLESVTPGAPLYAATEENVEEVKARIASELKADLRLDDEGILIKADTLGSLEALAFEMREANIPVRMARVGNVSRRDVIDAATFSDPKHRIVAAFNVEVLPDAEEALPENEVTLLKSDIVYRIIEAYDEHLSSLKAELEAQSREDLVYPGKVLFLPDHSFRISKPAIIGVRVLAGRVRQNQRLLREDGQPAGIVKSIRSGEETVDEAKQGDELALALQGVTIGRQIKEGEVYYVDIPGGDFRKLGSRDLTYDEEQVLEELAAIRRKQEKFWGM